MSSKQTMSDELEVDFHKEGVSATHIMSAAPPIPWHQPVMTASVLHYLNPRSGSIIVDGTVGTGGHSLAVLPRLLPSGRLVAIDRDREALAMARQRLAEFSPQVEFVHGNFRHLPRMLQRLGLSHVDGVLLDLGMSSLQVEHPERGFSFSREGPLDMRMDREEEATAGALINELSTDEIAMMLETLGEERFAKRIARQIVEQRRAHRITTTSQLARLVADASPPGARHGRLHPATRTFQALRMAVNDELGALQEALGELGTLLRPGGRVVILTFHSLEDRLVKQRFIQGMREGVWTMLTKKPVRPTAEEVSQNPRARSAKLRAIERC